MLNEHKIIGNLGNDPEIYVMQSGDKVAKLSIATTESYKDKTSGERKTITHWHKVVCFNQPLVKIIEQYVKKGSKVMVQGQVETRSWDKDGQKQYITETVMRPYSGQLIMLVSRGDNQQASSAPVSQADNAPVDELEDIIPF